MQENPRGPSRWVLTKGGNFKHKNFFSYSPFGDGISGVEGKQKTASEFASGPSESRTAAHPWHFLSVVHLL